MNSTEMRKEATLEAIGYICQDIDHRCLEEKSNEILTAIVHGMKKDEPSNHVRLAATNALLNSLEFTRANFEKDVSILHKTTQRKVCGRLSTKMSCFCRPSVISSCKWCAKRPWLPTHRSKCPPSSVSSRSCHCTIRYVIR